MSPFKKLKIPAWKALNEQESTWILHQFQIDLAEYAEIWGFFEPSLGLPKLSSHIRIIGDTRQPNEDDKYRDIIAHVKV